MDKANGLSEKELAKLVDERFLNEFNHTLHAYIGIAGDLVAGTLLSQLAYWLAKDEKGNVRATIKRNGSYWIAKRKCDWADELRITPRQFDRAINTLNRDKEKPLVEVKNFHFNNLRMTHIRLVEENFNEAVKLQKLKIAKEIMRDKSPTLPKVNLESENTENDTQNNKKELSKDTKGKLGNKPKVILQDAERDACYNIYNKYSDSNTEITSENTNNDYNTEITKRTEEEKEIKKKKPYIVLPDIPDAKPCEKNMDRDSKLFDMYANIRIKAMNVFKYDIESAKIITKVLENVCRTYEAETKYKHGIICGEGNIEKSIQFVIDNAKQLTAVIEQYQVFVNTHKSDYLHCQFTDFVNEFTERTA